MKLLTLARDLQRRKARERLRLFTAEGTRAVEDLLRSGLEVRGAVIAPAFTATERGSALADSLTARAIEVAAVSDAEFSSAAGTDSPQGILAIAEIPARTLDDLRVRDGCRILVLDGIQDPGNVGTIVRTAAALGATATLALPGTVDLWNAKVVRSSMGALFHHPALSCTAEDCRTFLARGEITLWAADAGGEDPGMTEPPARLAIALGNEGNGLSPFVKELASRTVGIPIASVTESLNVAVSAGILLYRLRP